MLKSLLALLLSKFYSKQESGEIAHQAMPMGDSITLNLTKGSDATYVAPTDGYFNVEIESSGYINCWGILLASASNGLWNKVYIPVKKGAVINYHIDGNIIYAAFVKLVGGGLLFNRIVQKGGYQCLKILLAFLQNSFSQTKRDGSDIKLCQALVSSLIHLYDNTWHRVMVGSAFVPFPPASIFLLPIQRLLYGVLVTQLHFHQQQQHCLSLRDKNLSLAPLKELLRCGSHHLTAPQLNFVVGGALC